ncbi:MAG: alpha/beta fold hydrolase [Thermodesulfobacteriota bacterium]
MKKAYKRIFLHGWATNASVWQGIAGKGEVINLPGHGSAGTWSEACLKPAIAETTAKLKDEKNVIGIGWSLGGNILIETASTDAAAFKALVLIGVSPCFTIKDDFPWAQKTSVVKKMLTDLKDDFQGTLARFYSLNFTEEELKHEKAGTFVRRMNEGISFLHKESVINSLKTLMNSDLRGKLSLLKIPVLIVHGRQDAITPFQAALYMKETIKNASLSVFESSGHAPFVSEPVKFKAILDGFTKGL